MITSEKLDELIEHNAVQEGLRHMDRPSLLPLHFRVRGQPYSLQDYPQLREMYASKYAPDTLFLCGRQVGKSMNLSRSEVLDAITVPHLQILFVAPLQQHTQRYSTLYLTEAIASCPDALFLQTDEARGMSDSKIMRTVMHQSFANGAGIQLTYAKTSSDRARGIFADRIDFDEIQDQLVDNIPIISESLSQSNWGIRRFTGTAKTTDNTIEALWQRSSMDEWAMPCACKSGEAGRFWNIPNLEGQVLKMIHPDGPTCVNCGKLLNARLGEFVPTHPDRVKIFRGLHIPQIVIPAITEDSQKWNTLIRKVVQYPVSLTLQEILGISCSLGARLITQKDIDAISVLPTMEQLQHKLHDYVFTIGGLDWGVAQQDSFTVHTIIGIKPDGNIDVLWAKRFVGFDPDEVLRQIAQAHRFYGCRMLGADFGMGFDKNIMLQDRFGLPVVQIQYVRQNRLLNYNPLLGQHRWTVDKTTALEVLFMAIKYGRIQMPPQEEFNSFTADLLSPYEEVSETTGFTVRRFLRNPNQPDDFCHALCFASLVAMKLMNASIANLVPGHAFGAGDASITTPEPGSVDPRDFLSNRV